MKSRFDFLWRGLRATLTGINLFLAMGMLAVYAIPWLDPRWLAPLALVGFLYVPLVAGLIICSVLWMIRRNARFWISVVIIALGWKVHSVWWQLPWPSDADPVTQALVQGDLQKAPIDSNRLGLFFSPIKELNMDILKTFGDFNIDNYIGDPSDEYKSEYRSLSQLRNYYFE
ncbi:MAG: hypothetical protein ACKOAV_05745, partial [Bacteroidota bacterium]